jgi:regulator of protease activity HflC (stomatin/prohibitin superfamily)
MFLLSLGLGLPLLLLVLGCMSLKILREWERGVVLRLGTFRAVRGPGIVLLLPVIDRMTRITTQVITLDIPPQDIITKDNITLKVHAIVFFHVASPKEAVIAVEDFEDATYEKAQTVLRSVLGQFELDDLLTQIDRIDHRLQSMLDAGTEPWGIKVDAVEVKHIDLPQEMQRAMAKQAEAERERRAKIIAAMANSRRPLGSPKPLR